jgi:Matrixin
MSADYLELCQKDDRLLRWADAAMPIKVYIAPFKWHERNKQQQDYLYLDMVRQAFLTWARLSEGKVRFAFETDIRNSQIDLKWRRVDRSTLGHCEYSFNSNGEIYSAEIQIGLTDGLVHPQYNSMDEVKHTVVHEIAHAIGLAGHSNQPGDIMYVPHQYGIADPSARDVATLQRLYRLPVGFDYKAVFQQLSQHGQITGACTFNRTVATYLGEMAVAANRVVADPLPNRSDVLRHHQELLTRMNQFAIQTQQVRVPPKVRNLYIQKKLSNPSEN